MTDTTRDLIQQLAGLARRKHYTCEDSWYNCPQSECGSANDNAGAECDCGADEHNAKVDAIWAALSLPEPEGPTVMEIIALADEIEAEGLGQVDLVRRALARWGSTLSTPQP
jgi:hypothetical protein